jgi:hypothetical protein
VAEGQSIEIRGGPELHRALRDLQHDLGDMTPVHKEAAEVIRQTTYAECPKDSGRLAASLKGSGDKNGARVESHLVYALPIENGWRRRNIAPARFAERGMTRAEPRVVKVYESGLQKMTKKAEG